MSFNLRIADANDGENSWENRKYACVEAVADQHPDVVGMQENSLAQDTFLMRNLTDYERVVVEREANNPVARNNSICYLRDRFNLISSDLLWLSETPHTFSKGWDGAYARFVIYALLEDKQTAERYLVLNTHIDHIGPVARREGVKMIAKTIRHLSGEKLAGVFVTGDFNTEPADRILRPLRKLMRSAQETMRNNNGTFHNWGREAKRIDYIFYRKTKPTDFHVVNNHYGVPFISDHYPVVATFE